MLSALVVKIIIENLCSTIATLSTPSPNKQLPEIQIKMESYQTLTPQNKLLWLLLLCSERYNIIEDLVKIIL